MKIFYFTGTGNSLYVAKRFGGKLYSIPKVLKSDQLYYEDDKIGIIFPCYVFATPSIVREFIEKVTLISPYIFAILTYGNKSADAVFWFTEYAKKNNVNIKYANSLLMVDNYLPLFDIEKQKQKPKYIEKNLNDLIIDVTQYREYIYKSSALDFFITNRIQHLLEKLVHIISSPNNFSINDKCNNCRTCAKVCPQNNISINDKPTNIKPVYGDTCAYCLACINLCPQQAIKLKIDRNPNARFKNENVTISEIIDSNNIQNI